MSVRNSGGIRSHDETASYSAGLQPCDSSADHTARSEFDHAIEHLAQAQIRPEVYLEEMAAPQRIATQAHALSGDVIIDDDELGTGTFVLLYEPDGHSSWAGTMRCVLFARADIDHEMAADSALPSVAWSWLNDALDLADADRDLMAGTTTIVRSDSFGQMSAKQARSQLELRASWSPRCTADKHLEAWSSVLCSIAGIPATSPGVIDIGAKRPHT